MRPLPRPNALRPTVALLLLAGLQACETVSIKFPDTASPDDTGVPDTGDTDTAVDTDTDPAPPVDPFPGTTPAAEADITLESAARSDGVGYAGSIAAPGDLVGSPDTDLLVGARYADAGGGPYSGAAYIVADPPAGRSSLAESAVTIRGTVDYAQFGTAVAAAGDLDGDGHADLAISAPAVEEGRVYIFRGPFAEGDQDDSLAPTTLVGDVEYAYAGQVLSTAGDVNGDGLRDLAVGAPNSSSGCMGCGAVMVSLVAGVDGSHLLADEAVRVYGDRTYGSVGYAVASDLDLDGDGNPEIVVGSPYSAGGGVGLLYGPFRSGSFGLSDADAWFASASPGSAAGSAITGADLDGDGYDELVVSAPQDSEAGSMGGKVYVESGSATRWNGEQELGSGAVYAGAATYAFGSSVAPAGDLDGDGSGDLLVGAPYASLGQPYAGAAFVILGPVLPGRYDMAGEDATFTGMGQSSYTGGSVSTAGDIDGGGRLDVAVGAMYGVEQGLGAVFVFLGEE